MKFVALLTAIVIALTLGCSSPSPVVGKWKPAQRYDRFNETWQPATDDVFLEFSADGNFTGFLKGKRTGGTYSVDTTGTPHRLTLNEGRSETTNASFKLEGNTLTLKSYLDTGAIFPLSVEPENNEPSFELVKFERQ